MKTTEKFAQHLKQLYTGGNWTGVCLKDVLEDVNLKMATQKVQNLNSILALTFHINYYIEAVSGVLNEGVLDAHDKYSFDHPEMTTEQEWQDFKETVLLNGSHLSEAIAALPDEILDTFFTDVKYGSYHRNFIGLLEHTHYHLGQMAILKKILAS